MVDRTNPVDVLARTIWGEARGDGKEGMQAVANVVCTRAANPMGWGDTIIGVCLARNQFDCWTPDETPGSDYLAMLAVTTADPDFELATNLASLAVQGVLPDITGGADCYYAVSMPEPPSFAIPQDFTCQIGSQRFYRAFLPPASREAPQPPATIIVPAPIPIPIPGANNVPNSGIN